MAGNSSAHRRRKTKGATATAKDILARIAPFVFIAGLLLAVANVLHLVIALNGGTDWWRHDARRPCSSRSSCWRPASP